MTDNICDHRIENIYTYIGAMGFQTPGVHGVNPPRVSSKGWLVGPPGQSPRDSKRIQGKTPWGSKSAFGELFDLLYICCESPKSVSYTHLTLPTKRIV